MPTPAPSILLDGLFSNAIGHAVEAFALANACKNSNPGAEIVLLLNFQIPAELAGCVEHLGFRVLFIDLDEFVDAGTSSPRFPQLRQGWDYLCLLRDAALGGWDHPSWRRYQDALKSWAGAKVVFSFPEFPGIDLPLPRPSPLHFKLPPAIEREYATYFREDVAPRILILPGGATFQKVASLEFWSEFIAAFTRAHPRTEFVLLGAFDLRHSATGGVTLSELQRFVERHANVRSALDVGIVRQLAIARHSHLLISPHSGMAFALQCMDVPWLALSAWRNPEYFTNGAPIESIYPRCPRYPCHGGDEDHLMLNECHTIISSRAGSLPCLSDQELLPRLAEIVAKAEMLAFRRCSYRSLIKEHKRQLAKRGFHFPLIENVAVSDAVQRYRERQRRGFARGPGPA